MQAMLGGSRVHLTALLVSEKLQLSLCIRNRALLTIASRQKRKPRRKYSARGQQLPATKNRQLRIKAGAARIHNARKLRARDSEFPNEWHCRRQLSGRQKLEQLISATVPRPCNDASSFVLASAFHINAQVAALEADGAVGVKLPALILKTVRLPLHNAAVLA